MGRLAKVVTKKSTQFDSIQFIPTGSEKIVNLLSKNEGDIELAMKNSLMTIHNAAYNGSYYLFD